MTRITKYGSTLKQTAYARRIFGAEGKNKQLIALDVGYSRHVANTPKSKIENTIGFNNAMKKLAMDSNNLALSVMSEFKARGFKDFSNKDLVGALNAIGGAWAKFNAGAIEGIRGEQDPGKNRLKTVILQRIENQTVNTTPQQVAEVKPIIDAEEVAVDDTDGNYNEGEEISDNEISPDMDF